MPSLDLYACSFCTIVLSCGDFVMNSDSKKHDYFAKVLSNHIYAVLMGTVHGRCTTTEKSKYCFANMGSFSSYDLTGPSGECGCLLSLPSLSWFLLVSGSGFSFSSHKMTFFFFPHLPWGLIMLRLLQSAPLLWSFVITESRAAGQQILWGWDRRTTALDKCCCCLKT